MATSGSTDFKPKGNDVIITAYRKCGVAVTASDNENMTFGRQALNAMLKLWQAADIYIHTKEWVIKTLTASSEVTGTTAGHIFTCIRAHTSSSTTRPITGAQYPMYWYERGSTGGGWVTATAYTSIGQFTPDSSTIAIEQAYFRKDNEDTQLPVRDIWDFMDIPDKWEEGEPLALYVLHETAGLSCYLVPQPDNADDYIIHYLARRRIEDIDADDDFDLTPEWTEALIYNLAVKLAPEKHLNLDERAWLQGEAKAALMAARLTNKTVTTGTFISPAYGVV
jgi:hypothetical protein